MVLEEVFKNTLLDEKEGVHYRWRNVISSMLCRWCGSITSSANYLEVHINEVNSKNKDNDLKMHKEKFMTNFNTDDSIMVEDQGIARVNEYKYCTKQ